MMAGGANTLILHEENGIRSDKTYDPYGKCVQWSSAAVRAGRTPEALAHGLSPIKPVDLAKTGSRAMSGRSCATSPREPTAPPGAGDLSKSRGWFAREQVRSRPAGDLRANQAMYRSHHVPGAGRRLLAWRRRAPCARSCADRALTKPFRRSTSVLGERRAARPCRVGG